MIKEVVRKSEISMLGLTGSTVSDEFQRSTEIESLQQFHMVSTETTDEDLTADTLTVVSASRDLNKGVDGTESRGGSEGLRKGKVVDFAS